MIPQTGAANSIKVTFLVHLVFIAWGTQGSWSPDSYLFYNLFFLLTLLWGVRCPDSEDPIQLGLCINLVSILLDIIVVCVYYPSFISLVGSERFSVGMAVVNLLLRPVSSFGLYRTLQERAGSAHVAVIPGADPGLFNVFGQNPPRGPYEDMDQSRAGQQAPLGTGTADKTYYNVG